MTNVLGAVLAGGRSTRFGRDKAMVTVAGKPLLQHAIDALHPVSKTVVLCGRNRDGMTCLPDRPIGGLGPLSGINAALHHARFLGLSWVLSLPCDMPSIDPDLLSSIAKAGFPHFVASQPVIGLWPSDAAEHLDEWLGAPNNRSMRHWADTIGALALHKDADVPNLNYESELADWAARGTLPPA